MKSVSKKKNTKYLHIKIKNTKFNEMNADLSDTMKDFISLDNRLKDTKNKTKGFEESRSPFRKDSD